ncbi:MAG: hypothetical protein KJ621_16645, partial [Proteobacteria bacterium]|nr:hypothetical protein [Pseudomonadota bacterium]
MGGVFRATAIFLATALLIGWFGVIVRAKPWYVIDWSHFEVRENHCPKSAVSMYTSQQGARYLEMLFLLLCNCQPPAVMCHPPDARHRTYVVGSAASDNKISCFRLGPNLAAKVFEHNVFEGQSTIFRQSTNLGGTPWNDRISSFIIFCRNQPNPLGAQVYMIWSYSPTVYMAFIPAPSPLAFYRVQYGHWPHHPKIIYRVVRTSLDVAWRACTFPNFKGKCYTVPENPNDKRLDVQVPLWISNNIRSFELWIISEADKYKCTKHGGGIVSCPYAQQQKAATQLGVKAKPFFLTGGRPPVVNAVKPPGGGPQQAYHPPIKVPFPADVTSEPNLNRPGLDYR